MLLLRAVSRLVTIVLLAALALARLVVAVCSIGSESTLSLPGWPINSSCLTCVTRSTTFSTPSRRRVGSRCAPARPASPP